MFWVLMRGFEWVMRRRKIIGPRKKLDMETKNTAWSKDRCKTEYRRKEYEEEKKWILERYIKGSIFRAKYLSSTSGGNGSDSCVRILVPEQVVPFTFHSVTLGIPSSVQKYWPWRPHSFSVWHHYSTSPRDLRDNGSELLKYDLNVYCSCSYWKFIMIVPY